MAPELGPPILAHCCHLVDHLDSLSGRREIPRPSVEAGTSYQNFPFIHILRLHNTLFKFAVNHYKERQGKEMSNKENFINYQIPFIKNQLSTLLLTELLIELKSFLGYIILFLY